jgi:hypothetical protein
MFNRHLWIIAGFALLTGCAHSKAVRVDCDGPLRPINQTATDQSPRKPAAAGSTRHKRSTVEANHER